MYAFDTFSLEKLSNAFVPNINRSGQELYSAIIQQCNQLENQDPQAPLSLLLKNLLTRERNGESNSIVVFTNTDPQNDGGIEIMGLCEIDMEQSRVSKNVYRFYIHQFELLPPFQNHRQMHVKLMKQLAEALKASPHSVTWVVEPSMEQIPWWIEADLIGSDEANRFAQMVLDPSRLEDDEFQHYFYFFLKDRLLYPNVLISWVMGTWDTKRALSFNPASKFLVSQSR